MPKTVETYRTTKALRALVRRAAKVVDKRPSEFLRQAAEEKARAVLREAAGENLRKLLARLPPAAPPPRPRPNGWARRRPGRPGRAAREARHRLVGDRGGAGLAESGVGFRVVLAAVAAGAAELVITDELEAEYRRAVEYPKVQAPSRPRGQAGVRRCRRRGRRASRARLGGRRGAADPGDDKVVAAALAGRVDFLVTLDRHLLDLAGLPGVLVVRPGDFLRKLRGQN